ncbi:protein yjbJ [Beauveria bassiana D1-5]|uniref:Protein yjbJ n=1 Tax=Beauveria bassiana D1-5 TaxID=1245745 RepID=A0A0A2VTY6_BEABA|nr:protein yjbJ [Beauveria bassiana D1-5]
MQKPKPNDEEMTMNKDEIGGNWKQFKGTIKEKWGKLTDDDMTVIEGKRDQLVGKIQERYGYARDQAEKEVKDWESAVVGFHAMHKTLLKQKVQRTVNGRRLSLWLADAQEIEQVIGAYGAGLLGHQAQNLKALWRQAYIALQAELFSLS